MRAKSCCLGKQGCQCRLLHGIFAAALKSPKKQHLLARSLAPYCSIAIGNGIGGGSGSGFRVDDEPTTSGSGATSAGGAVLLPGPVAVVTIGFCSFLPPPQPNHKELEQAQNGLPEPTEPLLLLPLLLLLIIIVLIIILQLRLLMSSKSLL